MPLDGFSPGVVCSPACTETVEAFSLGLEESGMLISRRYSSDAVWSCPEIIAELGANHSQQELLADIVGAISTVYSYHYSTCNLTIAFLDLQRVNCGVVGLFGVLDTFVEWENDREFAYFVMSTNSISEGYITWLRWSRTRVRRLT